MATATHDHHDDHDSGHGHDVIDAPLKWRERFVTRVNEFSEWKIYLIGGLMAIIAIAVVMGCLLTNQPLSDTEQVQRQPVAEMLPPEWGTAAGSDERLKEIGKMIDGLIKAGQVTQENFKSQSTQIESLKDEIALTNQQLAKMTERLDKIESARPAGGMTDAEKRSMDDRLRQIEAIVKQLQQNLSPVEVGQLREKVSDLETKVEEVRSTLASLPRTSAPPILGPPPATTSASGDPNDSWKSMNGLQRFAFAKDYCKGGDLPFSDNPSEAAPELMKFSWQEFQDFVKVACQSPKAQAKNMSGEMNRDELASLQHLLAKKHGWMN